MPSQSQSAGRKKRAGQKAQELPAFCLADRGCAWTGWPVRRGLWTSPEHERTLAPSGLADRPWPWPWRPSTLTATLGEAGYVGCVGLELPWDPWDPEPWRRTRDNGTSVMMPFCPGGRGYLSLSSVHSSRTLMAVWSDSDSRNLVCKLRPPSCSRRQGCCLHRSVGCGSCHLCRHKLLLGRLRVYVGTPGRVEYLLCRRLC